MKLLFTFRGKVKKNKGRGKLLGFPTANITLHKKIPEGIYASQVTIDGQNYLAATFIGPAKTFGEKDYKAESYILDFNKNIYGKWISVALFKKLRKNIRFDSAQALIKQMEKDVSAARKFFSTNS
ncbi:MAG: riboflavin kinase [Candidatus Levybacteria bacterium]|nr:riboflavin kinase [Candidatus Levybacteria bacterium]